MKPPPWDDVDTSVTASLLEELHLAVRAGRLVGLLKGRGLDRITIEELLRPESAFRLTAILTDHLYPEAHHGARAGRPNAEAGDAENGLGDGPRQGGKVLVYQRREGCGP